MSQTIGDNTKILGNFIHIYLFIFHNGYFKYKQQPSANQSTLRLMYANICLRLLLKKYIKKYIYIFIECFDI